MFLAVWVPSLIITLVWRLFITFLFFYFIFYFFIHHFSKTLPEMVSSQPFIKTVGPEKKSLFSRFRRKKIISRLQKIIISDLPRFVDILITIFRSSIFLHISLFLFLPIFVSINLIKIRFRRERKKTKREAKR